MTESIFCNTNAVERLLMVPARGARAAGRVGVLVGVRVVVTVAAGLVAVAVAVTTFVAVGGTAVAVTTFVAVGGTAVAVTTFVAVGGTAVAVATLVAVGVVVVAWIAAETGVKPATASNPTATSNIKIVFT